MREVERTVVRTDSVPVRVVDDSSSGWTVGFLVLAAIALIIGGISLYNNNNATTLRQQTLDMQQTALQQQQSSTQQLQDMTAAQQAMNANKPATTNVVVTDGLNGGAGPGSRAIVPPVVQPTSVTVNTTAPAPAAPPAPASPASPSDSSSSNP